MKIWFEQSGGVAGISISYSTDTDFLPAAEREMIEKIISSTNFFNLASRSSPPHRSADYFRYIIKVEDGTHNHTVEFTDLSRIPKLKPLVKLMRQKALASSKTDST
jgi:hypothetical protein